MDRVTAADDRKQAATSAVIVLGAGISGLVAASMLLKQGYTNVVVADEYDQIGGNHIDRSIGDYTFDIGSLIFQDDSPLLKHLPEILPLYVPINPSWGRLNPQGMVTQYPISIKDDIVRAGPIEWTRFIASVLVARIFRRNLKNAKDFAQYWIGGRLLHRTGLGHYMHRFYGLPADRIELKFAAKRMLWIQERASIGNVLSQLFKRPSSGTPNTQLARPREGFGRLYQVARQRLENAGVTFILGRKLLSLQKQDNLFFLDVGDQRVAATRVISTIPIEHAQRLVGMHPHDLQTVTLISLFYSFAGDRGFKDSVLYNFSHAGAWKRLTVYSDFYGPARGREFFAVEVNADHVQGSVAEADRDFRQHTADNGLFSGDLHLEGSHTLDNAYPVYTDNAGDIAASAIAALKEFGIESIGRQGGFDYQPTARDSTLKAEAALHRS